MDAIVAKVEEEFIATGRSLNELKEEMRSRYEEKTCGCVGKQGEEYGKETRRILYAGIYNDAKYRMDQIK